MLPGTKSHTISKHVVAAIRSLRTTSETNLTVNSALKRRSLWVICSSNVLDDYNSFRILEKFHHALLETARHEDVGPVVSGKAKQGIIIFTKLYNHKEFDELTNLCLGLSLQKYTLNYKLICNSIVSTVIPILYQIMSQWDQLN